MIISVSLSYRALGTPDPSYNALRGLGFRVQSLEIRQPEMPRS